MGYHLFQQKNPRVGDQDIPYLSHDNPADIPWADYQVDLVLNAAELSAQPRASNPT